MYVASYIVTVFYKRFRKICPQCNTVVYVMDCKRSTHLRKVCPQCNTVVHVKICDCGHGFASEKRKARCTAVREPENAIKCRKALLSEEELVRKERDKVHKASKRASETCA